MRQSDRPQRRYLFVCGTPRSGTTETCNILNVHPDIMIGIERYKTIYNQPSRAGEIGADLFQPSRFADIRATDTNIGLKYYRTVQNLEARLSTAVVAGDKLPRFYVHYDKLAAAFPGAQFLFLFRDPVRVASSWQMRADNENDPWPKDNDGGRAVEEWNKANALTLAFARAHPGQLAIVRYEDLFSGNHETLTQLLLWVGVSADKTVLRHYRQVSMPRARALAKKPLALAPGHEEAIRQSAQPALVDALRPFHLSEIAATIDLRARRRMQQAAPGVA